MNRSAKVSSLLLVVAPCGGRTTVAALIGEADRDATTAGTSQSIAKLANASANALRRSLDGSRPSVASAELAPLDSDPDRSWPRSRFLIQPIENGKASGAVSKP